MEARGSERPPSERKPASWTARIIAPIALAVAAAAIVLIVAGTLDSSDEDKSSTRETTASTGCAVAAEKAVKEGSYVIKAGENLTTVQEKTCVSEDELLELNPNLDPQLIPTRGCVNLEPGGCKKRAAG
jgi:hypothetical protein